MFFYMHAAFHCLETQKTQGFQHKNIRIFIYERRKKKANRVSLTNFLLKLFCTFMK